MKKLLKYLIPMIIFSSPACSSERQEYYFNKKPYVHPSIIEDLSSWVSDEGDQVVAINIDDSTESNRYYGEYKIAPAEKGDKDFHHNTGNPYVSIRRENACKPNSTERSPHFGYELIGMINDVYILHTSEASCGTGVWNNLMFVKLEKNTGLTYLKKEAKLTYTNKRNIVLKLYELPIGDRYKGHVKIEDNKVYIVTKGRKSPVITKDTIIELIEKK